MKITSSSWLRGIALSLLAVFTLGFANAATITVNGINYKTTPSKGTATVAKYTINKNPADTLWYTGDIVIPETITDDGGTTYTVVGTEANSFKDCKDVTSVVLPNTCVTIGRATFTGCTSLKVSPIPETVESVGSGVFKGCTSLEEVTVTNGWGNQAFLSETFSRCPLKKITFADGFNMPVKAGMWGLDTDAGSRVAMGTLEEIYLGGDPVFTEINNEQPFHNLTALKKLTFGGTATTIKANEFQGCSALEQIIFKDGVAIATIGSGAFTGCTSLQSFAFPAGVTEVAISTFFNCKALANVTLHDGITSIGATAFYNTALTSINLPNAITSIGQGAFNKSKLAGNLQLPSELKSIGAQAFAETKLTGVVMGDVKSIGAGAFAPIPTLASIEYNPGENAAFALNNGVLKNSTGTRLLVSAHQGEIGTSYADEAVESIDEFGLAYAPFESVDMPNLKTLGNSAFAYSKVKQFTIKSDMTLGSSLFGGSDLEELVIEDGRNEIPQALCANCAKLNKVTLSATATNMMKDCFANCTSLAEMEIPANVNYMEPGSVPTTIQKLRILNPEPPVLADGVFTAEQGNVECKVAVKSVSKFKAAPQWQYLNIVGDATIETAGASLGCPTGLYFTTRDGKLMYKDENDEIIDTGFTAGDHAFTLASYKNRIYCAVAGTKYTYQDPNQPLGDGELFYVNKTNDIFYRVTVLNNVGYAPSEDPFTMAIDSAANNIYIADRNVGVHQMSADAVGLYGSQPFLLQNQWLPYYNDQISWGSITGGFARDSKGIFWMSKKFNGLGLLRFTASDIYPDGGAGRPQHFKVLFKDCIIKTFYLDEVNGYMYMFVQTDVNGAVPGLYRIALNRIQNEDGSDIEGNDLLKIADCELIDDSPVSLENGNPDSGEIPNIAQINGDGEHIFWAYNPPQGTEKAVTGMPELDPENPLHKPGIKIISAIVDGTTPTTISYAVENVYAYGVTGATYVAPVEKKLYIVGNFSGEGDGWNPEEAEEMEDDGTGVYTITKTLADGDEFKFIGQKSWVGVDLGAEGDAAFELTDDFIAGADVTLIDGGKNFKVLKGGDYEIAVNLEGKVATFNRIPDPEPVLENLYLIGNFSGEIGWDLEAAEEMTLNEDNGTYEITKDLVAGDEFKFIGQRSWEGFDFGADADDAFELIEEYIGVDITLADKGKNFKVMHDGTYTMTVDPENMKFQFAAEFIPEPNELFIVGNFSGEGDGWDLEAAEALTLAEETGKFTITKDFAANSEFKLIAAKNWEDATTFGGVDEEGAGFFLVDPYLEKEITMVNPGANFKIEAAGTYTIVADKENATMVVTADEIPPTEIVVNEDDVTLDLGGDTYQLTWTVLPETATNKDVTFTSSDEGVLTVDEDGLVTAVKSGTWGVVTRAPRVEAVEPAHAKVTIAIEDYPDVAKDVNFTVLNPTGIRNIYGKTAVESVKYINVAGLESSKPFQGVNIIVTTYADGSRTIEKVVK